MPKHISTFENGINQDINVLAQPPGTYRDLENGMLISYDGNHYVVETALGNRVNFSIPSRYSPTGTAFALDTPPLPIGMISFIDKLVVFSTNDTTSGGGYGEIGVVTFDNGSNGTYLPIYNSVSLNFSKQHKIFGFTYAENDKITRVYWTDNNNEIRVINTVDPLLTAYITSGNIIAGTQYMVVNGAIEYPSGSGQYYGPGLPNGNIVIGSGSSTYNIADNGNNPTGVPIVIQYIDYHLLSFNPDRAMGSIDFNKWLSGGSLFGGSNMYFYRLKLANEGYVTSWSYGSFPINISGIPTTDYRQVVGAGYGGNLENTTRGIEIKISNIDTTYDTIEVAVAEFDQKLNVLTNAQIIFSEAITGAIMLFDHLGGENIQALSVNDLTLFPASILTCKDLCTDKNYIVIANLKERDEITFDATQIQIADYVHYMPADQEWLTSSEIAQGYPYQPASGVLSGNLVIYGTYQVTGGSINHNGTIYNSGETFMVTTVPTYTVTSGSPIVNACIIISRFASTTTITSGSIRQGITYMVNGTGSITYNSVPYSANQTFIGLPSITTFTSSGGATVVLPINKVIPILDDYWDYRGMASTQYLRQYWTKETYRFAILFYDLKGNPYFARWIADKEIRSGGGINSKGGLLVDGFQGGGGQKFSLTVNGLMFSNINIPTSLIPSITGFSIVRAPRDKQYMAQGIIWQTVPQGSNIRPSSMPATGDDQYGNAAGNGVSAVYNWYSPDAMFGFSDTNFANSGNILEGDASLDCSNPPTLNSTGTQMYVKPYYPTVSRPPNPFSIPITTFSNINPSGSFGNITPGESFENDELQPAGFNPIIGGKQATGNNCALIRTAFSIDNSSGDISGAGNLSFLGKPIANYKIPKGSLYGGQSADAIANTPFISTGHFQEINASILSHVPLVGGNYQFNNIEVYGGDSFVGIFDYCRNMYNDNLAGGSYSLTTLFPIESNVNHYLREGRHVTKDGAQNQTSGVVFSENGQTRLEDFQINEAYTSDGELFEYPALPTNYNITNKFPFRVRWGGPKIAGEKYDSFRVFLINNFRDLDGQRGQINNVATKQDKIYYWQDYGFGYLPILERQLVTGALGEATQLGVGGVIDRFDAYDTYFGNQHQSSLVTTEYGFSWFDMRRRAWMIMNIGGGKEEISVTKGLQVFFNTVFNNQTFTPSIINTDIPLIGIGIHGVYDPLFKTTILTFKNYQSKGERNPYVNYDFTVGYNHVKNVIIGFFPGMTPAIWHSHNHVLLSAKDARTIAGGNNTILPLHTYNVGDELVVNSTEYICVTSFTTHNPIQLYEMPDFVGSTLWTKMYSENQLYKSWNIGNICQHYGRVYPFSLEIIINPPTGEAITVDNLQLKSSPTNFDTIVYATDNDSAQDINLLLGNRNYRYIDNSWFGTTALGIKGRLTDYYLSVRMTLNNFTTNPTIPNNLQKIVEFIGSIFRIKR